MANTTRWRKVRDEDLQFLAKLFFLIGLTVGFVIGFIVDWVMYNG